MELLYQFFDGEDVARAKPAVDLRKESARGETPVRAIGGRVKGERRRDARVKAATAAESERSDQSDQSDLALACGCAWRAGGPAFYY